MDGRELTTRIKRQPAGAKKKRKTVAWKSGSKELLSFPLDALLLNDEMLGQFILGHQFETQAHEAGIATRSIPEAFAEGVRQWLLNQETSKVENAAYEKAIRKAAAGEFGIAGKIFRDHLFREAKIVNALDEAATGRRKQREKARNPRSDALSKQIEKIVDANPEITETELKSVLLNPVYRDVIDEITEESIAFNDKGRSLEAPLSGIKDRLSRAKKKLKSR